jgi:hypothetical protein
MVIPTPALELGVLCSTRLVGRKEDVMLSKSIARNRPIEEARRTLLLVAVIASLLAAGCSGGDMEARFHRLSDSTPAVEGTAEIRESNLGRTAVEVELTGLPEPGLLLGSDSGGVYLLWAEPPAGGAERLGQLVRNGESWTLVATSSLDNLRLFVTAEPEPDVSAPNAIRIATTGFVDVK